MKRAYGICLLGGVVAIALIYGIHCLISAIQADITLGRED